MTTMSSAYLNLSSLEQAFVFSRVYTPSATACTLSLTPKTLSAECSSPSTSLHSISACRSAEALLAA